MDVHHQRVLDVGKGRLVVQALERRQASPLDSSTRAGCSAGRPLILGEARGPDWGRPQDPDAQPSTRCVVGHSRGIPASNTVTPSLPVYDRSDRFDKRLDGGRADEPGLRSTGSSIWLPGRAQVMSLTDASAGTAKARVLMRATTKTVRRRRIGDLLIALGFVCTTTMDDGRLSAVSRDFAVRANLPSSGPLLAPSPSWEPFRPQGLQIATDGRGAHRDGISKLVDRRNSSRRPRFFQQPSHA